MTRLINSIANLGLDDFGRTILPEEVLESIENSIEFTTAGGHNATCNNGSGCSNTSNGTCSNSICEGSRNSKCVMEVGG